VPNNHLYETAHVHCHNPSKQINHIGCTYLKCHNPKDYVKTAREKITTLCKRLKTVTVHATIKSWKRETWHDLDTSWWPYL
jgi:hypothetical protein